MCFHSMIRMMYYVLLSTSFRNWTSQNQTMRSMTKNCLWLYNALNNDDLNSKNLCFWYKCWLITRICSTSWPWSSWHTDKHDELNICLDLISRSCTDPAIKVKNPMCWHDNHKICLWTPLTNESQTDYKFCCYLNDLRKYDLFSLTLNLTKMNLKLTNEIWILMNWWTTNTHMIHE